MMPKKLSAISWIRISVLICFVLTYSIAFAQTQSNNITSIAWSPDGNKIAIGYGSWQCDSEHPENYVVKIFNVQMTLLQTLSENQCYITSLAWNPDSTKLAASSGDTIGARVWNVQTGSLLMSAQRGGQGVTEVRWQPPNGLQLLAATVSNGIAVLNPTTGATIGSPPIGGTTIDWSPDGTKLLSASFYENTVYVADMVAGQQLMALQGHTGIVSTVDWSPDGTKLASGGGNDNPITYIWNASTGQALKILQGHSAYITEIKWSPDSTRLASASDDGTVRIWDVTTGLELANYQYQGRVQTVDWNPNGGYIIFGGARNDGQDANPEIEFVGMTEGFTLLDSSNAIITDLFENGAEIDPSTLASSTIKLRANTNPATVGSVKFNLNGTEYIDDTAPYELDWIATVGAYTLTATPYSDAGGTGTAGIAYTIHFSVINGE